MILCGAVPAFTGWMVAAIGWRSLFLIAPLLCLVSLWLTARCVPESPVQQGRRLDMVGVAMIGTALLALVVGLAAAQNGISQPETWVPLAISTVVAVLFVLHEGRTREPALDLALFRSTPFSVALAATLTLNFLAAGLGIVLGQFGSIVLSLSAEAIGLLYLPGTLLIAGAVILAGRLVGKYTPRPVLVTGLRVMAASGLLLAGTAGPTMAVWLLVLATWLCNLGSLVTSTSVSETVLSQAPPGRSGTVASVQMAFAMTAEAVAALQELDKQASVEEVARRLDGEVSPAVLALMKALVVQAAGLGTVTKTVESFGGFAKQYEQIEKVSAHHGNFWEVLLYGQIGRDRTLMFDLAEKQFTATSEDGRVLDALAHAQRNEAARGEYISAIGEDGTRVDISFATQNWQKAVVDGTRPGQFVRKHFEAMVFTYLAEEPRTANRGARPPAGQPLTKIFMSLLAATTPPASISASVPLPTGNASLLQALPGRKGSSGNRAHGRRACRARCKSGWVPPPPAYGACRAGWGAERATCTRRYGRTARGPCPTGWRRRFVALLRRSPRWCAARATLRLPCRGQNGPSARPPPTWP
ncbi:MFS transporter [Streptomyces sp. NPDC007856]|uniref:MFS transporter n=1 Tax=Streptomyces sp. NPDC007856 TaxID=3364781 RepID=UPI00368254F5